MNLLWRYFPGQSGLDRLLLDRGAACRWYGNFITYIKVKLFADDLKIYITIADDTDVQRLQLALDALVLWSDTWQLPISINKCCLLNVGKNSHGIVVSIGGSTLPVVTHTRDLRIIVSSDLLYMSLILFMKPTCVLV